MNTLEFDPQSLDYLVPFSRKGIDTFSVAMGAEASVVMGEMKLAGEHMLLPVQKELFHERLKFNDLAARWRQESSRLSTATAAAMLPTYQRIIGMGMRAVPYILGELAKQPDHWFWALKAITNEDPVRNEHRGKVPQMAADWLAWGRSKGYL